MACDGTGQGTTRASSPLTTTGHRVDTAHKGKWPSTATLGPSSAGQDGAPLFTRAEAQHAARYNEYVSSFSCDCVRVRPGSFIASKLPYIEGILLWNFWASTN